MKSERKCGSCRVCCVVMKITELNKPEFTSCDHLVKRQTTRSCGIYNDRPEECRTFQCAWLTGLGTNNQRPDRCGVMLTGTASYENEPPVPVIQGFRFRDSVSPHGSALWEQATDHGVVLEVKSDGSRKLHGSNRNVGTFLQWVRTQQEVAS